MKSKLLIKLTTLLFLTCTTQLLHAEEPEFKIGAIYGLTGFANIWSVQAQRGIEMAVRELNQNGGVGGRKVRIIFEDSGSKPANAVTAFHKLVTVDKVEAVVGDIISFLTMPLIPLANHYKVMLVTPSVFDAELPKDSQYVFTTCPRQKSLEAPVSSFFALNPQVAKVGILCAENGWGHAYLDVWTAIAKSKNIEIVDTLCTQDFSTDFKMELTRLKIKKPDAVIIPFATDKAIRRMKELNFDALVLTTSDLVEAVDYRSLPLAQTKGMYFNDWPAEKVFSDRFKEEYGEEAIMEPQNSYEAIRAIVKAYEKDPSELSKGIRQVKYKGVSGMIDFTESHAGNYAEAKLYKSTGTEFVPAN